MANPKHGAWRIGCFVLAVAAIGEGLPIVPTLALLGVAYYSLAWALKSEESD